MTEKHIRLILSPREAEVLLSVVKAEKWHLTMQVLPEFKGKREYIQEIDRLYCKLKAKKDALK